MRGVLKPAADHDARRAAPRRELQEALDHLGERMRKLLDGADQHARRDRIAVQQDFFQLLLLLVELLRRNIAQRVGLAEFLAPAIQHRLERLLVGAVAQEGAVLAKLDVVIVDMDRAQLARAMGQGAGGGGR